MSHLNVDEDFSDEDGALAQYQVNTPTVCPITNIVTSTSKATEAKPQGVEDRKLVSGLVKSVEKCLSELNIIRDKCNEKLAEPWPQVAVRGSKGATGGSGAAKEPKKEKKPILIKKEDLQSHYQFLFAKDIKEMDLEALETVIKSYFFNPSSGVLKSDDNYGNVAVTKQEFAIHQQALLDKHSEVKGTPVNCITIKDIPVLIKRMYTTIDECVWVTNSGVEITLKYDDLVSCPPHNIISFLQQRKLIHLPRGTTTSSAVYQRAKSLTYLLDQIPRFKVYNLIETNLSGFNTLESLTKLIYSLQDPLTIYFNVVNTSVAKENANKLNLPVVDWQKNKWFKLETFLKQYKDAKKVEGVALPGKDDCFDQLVKDSQEYESELIDE